MPYCESCGEKIKEGATYCPSCGEKQRGTDVKSDVGEEGLFWTAKSQVITSRPVVTQIIMAFGLACLIVLAFLFIIDVDAGLTAAPYILGIMIGFIVLGLIIAAAIQFFTKGGPDTDFAVTKDGIGYRAGKASKAINRATLAGTAIGGSLAGAGGSMINISREMDFMSWKEMRSITVYPRERSLLFYRKVLLFPFALYCTPENFETVKGLIRKYAPDVPYKEKRW
jgi:hypothetical protein